MKKIYSLLVMALMALTSSAANADWYLYVWSDNQNAGGDLGQFQTTDTDGVFLLEGAQVAEEGVKFCIHNASWGEMYGWDDEGGSVDAVDKVVKLAPSSGANGWLALPVGTYNVTWNANDKTVTFAASSSTSVKVDWFIYYWDDASSTGGDLAQFKTTDTDGVFAASDVELTIAEGVKFCIHSAAWSTTYGWNWAEGTTGGSVTEAGVEVPLEASSSASAWLGLPVGKYNVTWNSTAMTVRFDLASPAGIDNVKQEAARGATYNLAGQRVDARHKGIVIVNGKKQVVK